MGDLNRTWNSI